MYALIKHTSDNAKDIEFNVYYNDVMYELHGIEINGAYYDLTKQPQARQLKMYYYMVGRINVWAEITFYEREIHNNALDVWSENESFETDSYFMDLM
jgi:hypothetical protein